MNYRFVLLVCIISGLFFSCGKKNNRAVKKNTHSENASGDEKTYTTERIASLIRQNTSQKNLSSILNSVKPDVLEKKLKNGIQLIHLSSETGNDIALQILIKRGISSNTEDQNGNTPLHYAVKFKKSIRTVKLLLENGAAINFRNMINETPLHLAASEYNPDILKLLLTNYNDCKIDYPDHNSVASAAVKSHHLEAIKILSKSCFSDTLNTPEVIHLAVKEGDLPITRWLITNDSKNLSHTDSHGYTPLHTAALYGKSDIIEFLLKQNVYIGSRDKKGRIALHLAALNGNIKALKILSKTRVWLDTPDYQKKTPLMLAVENNKFSSAKFLIDANATINMVDNNGNRTLHYAVKSGNTLLVKLLIQNKTSLELPGEAGNSPLHTAAAEGHFEIAKLLLENNAEINKKNNIGDTPLHLAMSDIPVSMKTDLDFIISIQKSIKNKSGRTAKALKKTITYIKNRINLDRAKRKGKFSIAKYLIRKKANLRIKNHLGRSVLSLAAISGSRELFDILRKRNISENITDKKGFSLTHHSAIGGNTDIIKAVYKMNIPSKKDNVLSPIHLAARYNRLEVVKFLLSQSNKINHLSIKGFTPLFLSSLLNSTDTAKYLRSKGALSLVKKIVQPPELLKDSINNLRYSFDPLIDYKIRELINAPVDFISEVSLWKFYKKIRFIHSLLDKSSVLKNVQKSHLLSDLMKIDFFPVFRMLQKQGIHFSENKSSNTLLNSALKKGFYDIAAFFLDNGTDPAKKDSKGNYALHAFLEGLSPEKLIPPEGYRIFLKIVKSIRDINAQNSYGNTSVILACKNGDFRIINELLRKKPDLKITNKLNQSPMTVSLTRGNYEIFKLVIENGGSLKDIKNQKSVMHLAAIGGNIKIISMLYKNGYRDTDYKDGETGGAFFSAGSGKYKAFKFFYKPSISKIINAAKDKSGNTLAHYASEGGNAKIISELKNKISFIIKNNEGETPFFSACKSNLKPNLDLFSDIPLEINSKNKKGLTPLHVAVIHGNYKAVKWLIKKGANTEIEDNKGKFPGNYCTAECVQDFPHLTALLRKNHIKNLKP
ncbi:MAG: ankyrin repeat domain-containing protein [Deltaproteobacteria bacterium]|nr:ankyrin repeat domain-containing protein [Deltaproteobacteria bacterium]